MCFDVLGYRLVGFLDALDRLHTLHRSVGSNADQVAAFNRIAASPLQRGNWQMGIEIQDAREIRETLPRREVSLRGRPNCVSGLLRSGPGTLGASLVAIGFQLLPEMASVRQHRSSEHDLDSGKG